MFSRDLISRKTEEPSAAGQDGELPRQKLQAETWAKHLATAAFDHAASVQTKASVTRNYNASESAYNRLQSDYEALPPRIRRMLVENRYTIGLGRSLEDASPDLKDQWWDGTLGRAPTNRSFGARMADQRRISLAEQAQMSDGSWQNNAFLGATMRTYVGYFVDEKLGFSKQKEFRAALKADAAELPQELRNHYHRYILEGQSGPSNMFSAQFSLATRQSNSDLLNEKLQDILQHFPRTEQVVLKQLQKYVQPEQLQRIQTLDQSAQKPIHRSPEFSSKMDEMATSIEGLAARAQTGDKNSRVEIYQRLKGLTWEERDQVVNSLRWRLGDGEKNGKSYSPGVYVRQDVIGHARSIGFLPVGSLKRHETRPRSVEVNAGLFENYYAGDPHAQAVEKAVDNLPPKIAAMLKDNNWVIASVINMTNGHPAIDETYAPPEFCPTHDCDAGLALSDQRRIMIAEYVKDKDAPLAPLRLPVDSVVRHEVGHAVDSILGYLSQKKEFIDAFDAERAAVPEQQRGQIDHYIGDGPIGRQEMFAQLFENLTVGVGGTLDPRDGLISWYFPKTAAIVRKQLAAYLN